MAALKIYYIDDEPDLLELFVDTFSSAEREIMVFLDPFAAVAEAKKNPPDLLFIDYRLPGITGDIVAAMLDPAIPKALISGEVSLDTKHNFDAFFPKPYKKSDIEDFIQKHVKK